MYSPEIVTFFCFSAISLASVEIKWINSVDGQPPVGPIKVRDSAPVQQSAIRSLASFIQDRCGGRSSVTTRATVAKRVYGQCDEQ